MGNCAGEKPKKTQRLKTMTPGQITKNDLIEAIDRMFEKYDKDENGSLDKNQLINLIKTSLGQVQLSTKDIDEFVQKVDSDGNRMIEREELYFFYSRYINKMEEEKNYDDKKSIK